MFKIKKLTMVSASGETFTYEFKIGINYFKGVNSSGKTEFYNFIDYMFGSSQRIDNKVWFKGTLDHSVLEFEYKGISYQIKRTMDRDVNFFKYSDENFGESINLGEYKDKLNSVFATNIALLKDIRDFTEEDLSFRTFTLFNFLGEKGLGIVNDFFDKGRDVKYAVKLPAILNFIFNNNLERIFSLKKELEILQSEVKKLEASINKFEFVKNHINLNLKKLNISTLYTGKNKTDILYEINAIKSLEDTKKTTKKSKTISELESIYNSLSDQIKIYENTIEDNKKFENESINRKVLLESLMQLIENRNEFRYLVEPLVSITQDLDKSISFNKYIINNNTIKELKKQKDTIKEEIKTNDIRFSCFNISDKARAVALVEEYLNIDVDYNTDDLSAKRKRIRELIAEIKALQNSDNDVKVNNLSDYITKLYKSAKDVSDIVKNDSNLDGFYIQYYKKGNLLQPQINNLLSNIGKGKENYYIGSMARHTLIQLCGYLGFLNLLIKENKYPLIPIFVIDHISKPFDLDNRKAIGAILKEIYNDLHKHDFQIFMFDDESYEDLSIIPDHYEDLATEAKTGFNPFYHEDTNN